MRVEFLVPAIAEYRAAIDWFSGMGAPVEDRFRRRVSSAIDAAVARPSSAGFLNGSGVRKILLRPFDYGLLYFCSGNILYVIAVAHNKRRPRYWKHRLNRI